MGSELALRLGMQAREQQGRVFVASDGGCEVMPGGGDDGGSGEDENIAPV